PVRREELLQQRPEPARVEMGGVLEAGSIPDEAGPSCGECVPGGRTGRGEDARRVPPLRFESEAQQVERRGCGGQGGHGARSYSARSSRRKSSASSITSIPSASALASLSPASLPATTAVVLRDTADLTTP